MKRKALVPSARLITWMLLISLFIGQSPAAGKDKDNAASGAKPAHPITVRVTPTFAIEGSPVQAMVRVAPDAENRLLRISVDSESYFRSSDVQLDGDNAAITHYLQMHSLPAGEYAFLAVVYGPNRERGRSHETFRLLPRKP